MKKSIVILLILIAVAACSDAPENKTTVQKNFYSIQPIYNSITDIEDEYERLTDALTDTVILKGDSLLLIGLFETYRKTSDRGFELTADGLIEDYRIYHDKSAVTNDYSRLYFVGLDLGRPSLYSTSLFKLEPELVYSKWGRSITELYRNDERDNYFFTTCLVQGIRGNFSFIRNARLYHLSRNAETINLINTLGDGLSLHANWFGKDEFSVYFNELDSLMTSTLSQTVFTYNRYGEPQDTTERIYELIKEGIPIPNFSEIVNTSPNLRYKIDIKKNDSLSTLSIFDEIDSSINEIISFKGSIEKAIWNTASDYLFCTMKENADNDSLKLFFIDMQSMQIKNNFVRRGEMNFIVIGNLLVFDSGFEENSYITLYRYRKNQVYDEIKIPGGCGVKNIPAVSNFYR